MDEQSLIRTMKLNMDGHSTREKKILDNSAQKNEKIEKLADDVKTEIGSSYEMVNHPKHYNRYDMETIDMMVKLWGIDNTITFCKMNAFKYRMRLGMKPGSTILQDIEKEKWYLNKAEELEELKSPFKKN